MNLLAHLHLSTGLPAEETAGNVLADFLPNNLTTSTGIARGIRLHRQIDGFTDRHPLVAEARELISPSRRRLASIIIDVAFDFTLCRKWDQHCEQSLPRFIENGYCIVEYGARELGGKSSHLISRMRHNRWLESYGSLDGIGLTFRRMTRRSDLLSNLAGAEQEVAAQLAGLQSIFDQFYPELAAHAQATVAEDQRPPGRAGATSSRLGDPPAGDP